MVDVGDDLTYDWDDGTNGGATHIDEWGWNCATENLYIIWLQYPII